LSWCHRSCTSDLGQVSKEEEEEKQEEAAKKRVDGSSGRRKVEGKQNEEEGLPSVGFLA
jgi:hypothetical protein